MRAASVCELADLDVTLFSKKRRHLSEHSIEAHVLRTSDLYFASPAECMREQGI